MRRISKQDGYLAVSAALLLFCVSAAAQEYAGGPSVIRFGIIDPPVVAQQDLTVRAATSNQQVEEKPLECSGLGWLNGCLLISSDRHEHLVFVCPIDLETMDIGRPDPRIVIRNEQYLVNDIESLTILSRQGQNTLILMSSLSNAPNGQPLPQRRHLFAADIRRVNPFDTGRPTVFSVGILRSQLERLFERLEVTPYFAYYEEYPGDDKNTYRWANIEGITFTPDGRMLLCGLRNPLYQNKAVLFVVSGMPEAIRALEPDVLVISDIFLLDLNGRGVSDLVWDPVTQGYLITAAKSNGPRRDQDAPYPLNSLDSALFWWSGHKDDKPILTALIPDMTIEAVCRLGKSRYIALGSDEGDISEGRSYRQSVLTIMEFVGIR